MLGDNCTLHVEFTGTPTSQQSTPLLCTSWQPKTALFTVQVPLQTTLRMGAMGAAPMMTLRQQPGLPMPTISSRSCLRATAPLWVTAAPCFQGASANASPLPAPCSRWVPVQHLPGLALETPWHLIPSVRVGGVFIKVLHIAHLSGRLSAWKDHCQRVGIADAPIEVPELPP